MSRRRKLVTWVGVGVGVVLVLLCLAAGIAWRQARAKSRLADLALAREAMSAGRFGRAHAVLSKLAESWVRDGEVLLLLGECEIRRGRRDDALAAWAEVPPTSPAFAPAARARASILIQMGKYAPAEELLLQALADPERLNDYALVRELIRLYRAEGRYDDVRHALRASWSRSADPAAGLAELWLLDHAATQVELLKFELDRADGDDDRVWLGRARHALLVGRFSDASRWLDACSKRRPRDVAVGRARLDLALATDDVSGFWSAAASLPSERFEANEVREMMAWLAARRGDAEVERRELSTLIQEDPGNTRAFERLALLATQAGRVDEATRIRRRKAEVDAAQQRFHHMIEDGGFDADRAATLAGLADQLGRGFEARGWALLAEAMPPTGKDSASSKPSPQASRSLAAKAMELTAPYSVLTPEGSSDGPTLGGRLADLGVADTKRRDGQVADGSAAGRDDNGSRKARPEFVDVAEATGLRFVFDNGLSPERLLPETLSGGVGLIDYDGDGRLDVYCLQGGDIHAEDVGRSRNVSTPGDRLFRNRGDGSFQDVTEETGIAVLAWGRGYGQGVTAGDYDNDGRPDLFVTRIQSYALYRNRGDGTFEEVTEAAGLAGPRETPTSAAFADLDNDGDLDLYVCHYMLWDPKNPQVCRNPAGELIYCSPRQAQAAADHVFRNDGGRFVDVTEEAGFAETEGRGLGVVAADFDDDNLIDLFVANDGSANYLFHNLGNFRFEEVAHTSGTAGNAAGGYQAGMGVACGDLDGDGRPDLMVTNFYGEGTTHFKNLGKGLFCDFSASSGIGLATRYLLGFGIAFVDVDNDGRLDVMAANGHVNGPPPSYRFPMPARLYEGRPDGRFVDVSHEAGPPWDVPRVGRGLAVGDVDNDGLCDAVIASQNSPVAYFHNKTRHAGRFATVRLEGTTSNRDGVGALVAVTAGGRRQVAQRVGGGSYMGSNDPRLHFGLGPSDSVEKIEVRWPSGKLDRWLALPAGTGYILQEGDPTPRPLPEFARKGGA